MLFSSVFQARTFLVFFSPEVFSLTNDEKRREREVVLVDERPLAQAVKSFELGDPITLPFTCPESKPDPRDLIGRLKNRFLEGLPLINKTVCCVSKISSCSGCQSKGVGVDMEVRELSVGTRGIFFCVISLYDLPTKFQTFYLVCVSDHLTITCLRIDPAC